VTIFGPAAASLDPAVTSDAGSAQVVAQVFESLTAIDSVGKVQPALAQSWQISTGAKGITFTLRPGLTFSDGSPLTAGDVVSSWMRVLAPDQPSQLASLLDDVVGARAYREGSGSKTAVGFRAVGDAQVSVDLINPAADFAAIVSSPTLAVVPPQIDSNPAVLQPGSFVASGGYVVSRLSDTETTLTANPRYWAGSPAIKTVHLLNSIGGRNEVSAFMAGDVDYTPISRIDASWVAYDKTLGPDLRIESSPAVEFYGFDTSKAPFSDVHVRRAFALGIDWRRIVNLLGDPLEVPATGMVPPGVPGHSQTDFGPKFDLAAARAELATAGYPNGVGFPKVTLATGGAPLDGSIVAQLHDNLGIDIDYRTYDGAYLDAKGQPVGTYFDLLLKSPPAMWEMDWVADYPGANDFLGLLLGSGTTNNFGRWRSSQFDAAISTALSSTDAASLQKGFDAAQAIVLDQAPVIPVDYGVTYSMAAPQLLGAIPNTQGLVRYAGLAWGAGR
jgi:ABC-type transport system substrate-binding protein